MNEELKDRIKTDMNKKGVDRVPFDYGVNNLANHWFIGWDYRTQLVLEKEEESEEDMRYAIDEIRDEIRFKTYREVEDAMEELEKTPEPTSENIQKIVQAVIALNAEIMSL